MSTCENLRGLWVRPIRMGAGVREANARWQESKPAGRARENREYVRMLLAERQPWLASTLDAIVRES